MLEVTLTLNTPEGTRHIPVTEGRLTIGRDDAANLCLTDPGLSRLHASLYRESERIWIADEGSMNGSYVNGERVSRAGHTLADRDKISMGDYTTLWVSITRAAAEQPVQAMTKKTSAGLPLAPLLMVSGVCLILAVALAVKLVGSHAETRDPVSTPAPPSPPEIKNANASIDPPPPQTDNANFNPIRNENQNRPTGPVAAARLYRQLSDSEKMDFVMRQAERISRKMGNRPCNFTPGALQRIKAFVDGYASRIGREGKGFKNDLRVIYERATHYAPLIIRAFNKYEVYPEVGLYMAMIESEYNKCLTSTAGAKGMFQFMPGTASDFGISPEDRCDEEKMAPVAAKFFKQLIGQFGTDAFSVALAIASYNRGPAWISSDLHKAVESRDERSFWTLVENAKSLPTPFQTQTIDYVPKFFAAAIIGENPSAFALQMRELSTYTQAPAPQ